MVDIDTHRIVDVLELREIDDVAQWLKTYPNLDMVSRDGSVSYNSAIKKANSDIVQVSDRFHLVKGLTDAAKKHITRIVAANIGIPSSGSHYEREQASVYWEKPSEDGAIEKIERKWLVKLLYKPLDTIKGLSQESLDQVIEQYPIMGDIYDVVGSFKQTLFGKKPEELEEWLKEAEGLHIEVIQSFVNGIRQDLPAVKKQ